MRISTLHKQGNELVCSLLILCTLATAQAETKRIVGYYYGKGRPGYQFSQVPVQKLTHLIYSLAKPTARGNCELAHPGVDVPNLRALKVLRAKNARLSVLLSVGGWSGSTYFSDVAATPSARKQFSASCLEIVQKYGLDGLDIDWEYPVTGGKPTDHKRKSDKENFVLLLKQLRSDLDAFDIGRHLLLTIASTGYRNHLPDLSLKEMSDVLDWFNLMGYDFNEMQPGRTSHHSGLFAWPAASKLDADAIQYANSDAAVQWYLDHGVPPEKIVLGVPFYGQIWANVPDQNDGLFESVPRQARRRRHLELSRNRTRLSSLIRPALGRSSQSALAVQERDENHDQLRGLRIDSREGEVCNSEKPRRNDVLGPWSGRQQVDSS
jgi:chitinase